MAGDAHLAPPVVHSATAGLIVLDVGGTTLRVGRYDPASGALSAVRRVPVEGMARHPGESVPVLQKRIVDQIVHEVSRYRAATAGPVADAIGVAFAGPVADGGVVVAAPTIWGGPGDPLPLTRLLEQRLGLPVVVVNDLTAAAWRYVDRWPDPFCLITVSSGIGNKVFHAGRVMIDADGFGGEIGHWTCDPSPDAPRCECGGRGHLGGIASGRGTVATALRLREQAPDLFATSVLARGADEAPPDIDAASLARAAAAGDRFATAALRVGLSHLAAAMSLLFTAVGLRRFIVMGGFALGVGSRYTELLAEELVRRGCFGLPAERIRHLVTLADTDDDHGLIGIGTLLSRHRQPLATEQGSTGRGDEREGGTRWGC
jgi:glucokinase